MENALKGGYLTLDRRLTLKICAKIPENGKAAGRAPVFAPDESRADSQGGPFALSISKANLDAIQIFLFGQALVDEAMVLTIHLRSHDLGTEGVVFLLV